MSSSLPSTLFVALLALLASLANAGVVTAKPPVAAPTTIASLQGSWHGICQQYAAFIVGDKSESVSCLSYKASGPITYRYNA